MRDEGMIELWKETVVESAAFYIAWGGLAIGIIFGFIVSRTNFCTMGSISDILTFGDYRRFRSVLLASATAVFGVLVLQGVGVADMGDSMYMAPRFTYGANIVGGSMFGFGMVFAGGCISRNLVRAGGGDLRSVIVLTITGIFAYITIGGLLGPARVVLFAPVSLDLTQYGMKTQGVGAFLAAITGIDATNGALISGLVIAGAMYAYIFKDKGFRSSAPHMIAGFGIGLAVVAGWFLTGLAFDDFADVPVQLISLSFVRPSGDTLDYAMRFTALGPPGFGVVTLVGVLIGGFLGAASMGRLHLVTFADKSDTVRNMFGGAFMGVGGVIGLGCTVGQGMTGFSTLAIGSFVTFLFIILGGIGGMKVMENLA
jgi:uncharacterized protein